MLGPCKDSRYVLVSTDDSKGDVDPYRPSVVFPDTSTERHGGRKLNRLAKRGVIFKSIVEKAFSSLGYTLKKQKMEEENKFPSVDTEDTMETECDNSPHLAEEDSFVTSTCNKKSACTASQMVKEKPILCSSCITNKISPPFICATQNELMKHIAIKHNMPLFTCSTRWSQTGSLIHFQDEIRLKRHVKVQHKPKKPKLSASNSATSKPPNIANASTNPSTTMDFVEQKQQPGLQNITKEKLVKNTKKFKTPPDIIQETKRKRIKT